MSTEVKVYDTTLRDGSQGEGVQFSLNDKLLVTRELDAFGVDYIEGGYPGSNGKDTRYFQQVRGLDLQHAKVVAFGTTCRPGVLAAADKGLHDLKNAGTSVITIVGKGDIFQVERVLRTTPEENLRMVAESVAYLKALPHVTEVFLDVEHFFDGFLKNSKYALEVLKAGAEGGADCLVLCDTNGGSLPCLIARAVKAALAVGVPLGIHTHNDGDLAVANTLAAVEHGATQVQGTINGFGERCGNADLCSVLANLALKYPRRRISPSIQIPRLRHLSQVVYTAANLMPRTNQPYVGASAFAHKAGLHVNGQAKTITAYEHVDPATVGGQRRVLVGELSGLTSVDVKLREMGLELSHEQLAQVLEEIKRAAALGLEYEGADASLFLLACRVLGRPRIWFRVVDGTYHDRHRPDDGDAPTASSLAPGTLEPTNDAMATVKGVIEYVGRLNPEQPALNPIPFHTVAEGAGPVDAFDAALRKALTVYSPEQARRMGLDALELTDYKVRARTENDCGPVWRYAFRRDGTKALVRVLATYSNGDCTWTAVGVGQNVVRASFNAVTDAFRYWAAVTQLREAATATWRGHATVQEPRGRTNHDGSVSDPVLLPILCG